AQGRRPELRGHAKIIDVDAQGLEGRERHVVTLGHRSDGHHRADRLGDMTERQGDTMTEQHPGAHGYGVATLTEDGTVLDVWFPEPRLGAAGPGDREPDELVRLTGDDPVRLVRRVLVHVVIDDLADAP